MTTERTSAIMAVFEPNMVRLHSAASDVWSLSRRGRTAVGVCQLIRLPVCWYVRVNEYTDQSSPTVGRELPNPELTPPRTLLST